MNASNWRERSADAREGSCSRLAAMSAAIAGYRPAISRAIVLKSNRGVLREASARSKKKDEARNPSALSTFAMALDIAVFPDPATPFKQKMRRLSRDRDQSWTKDSTVTRVPGKQARLGFQEAPSAYGSLSRADDSLILATKIAFSVCKEVKGFVINTDLSQLHRLRKRYNRLLHC